LGKTPTRGRYGCLVRVFDEENEYDNLCSESEIVFRNFTEEFLESFMAEFD